MRAQWAPFCNFRGVLHQERGQKKGATEKAWIQVTAESRMFDSWNNGSLRLQMVISPVFYYNYYYHCICVEEKRITQKQLKKVENANTETNKEEKGNWDSKRLLLLEATLYEFQSIEQRSYQSYC